MVGGEPGAESREDAPLGEPRVGGGDPIRVTKLTSQIEKNTITEGGGTLSETVEVELTADEIREIMDALPELPFHIGLAAGTEASGPEGVFTDSDRPAHEADVSISPYASGMPKGKETYLIAFHFKGKEVWDSGMSPHSAKDLEISQPMHASAENWDEGREKEEINVRVGFSPENKLVIGGREIEEIVLLAQR